MAEGFLTRNSIHEYYKEFFANDLCKDDQEKTDKPQFCDYMRHQIDLNEDWLQKKIQEEADTDPYWHMVRMFYIQVITMVRMRKELSRWTASLRAGR